MTRVVAGLCVVCLLAMGCSGGSSAASSTDQAKGAQASSTTGANAGSAADTSKTASDDSSKSGDAVAATASVAVPKDLQGDAYNYSGFADHAAHPFEMVIQGPGAGTYTGTMQCTVTGVKDGVADVQIARTGTLGNELGSDQMELKKTGAYIVGNTRVDPAQPTMDLPAHVSVGTTWNSKTMFTVTGGTSVTVESHSKATKLETVHTKGGEFQAMLVEAHNTVTQGGSSHSMVMKQWYSPGTGIVKVEMHVPGAKGKAQDVVIQRTK